MTDDDRFNIETDGEYTRFRISAKRGDGPDQRGKVETELVRKRAEARIDRREVEVELPDGTTKTITVDDAPFAEFIFEADRAVTMLENRLGLDNPAAED
jgi:hypothetical protein